MLPFDFKHLTASIDWDLDRSFNYWPKQLYNIIGANIDLSYKFSGVDLLLMQHLKYLRENVTKVQKLTSGWVSKFFIAVSNP